MSLIQQEPQDAASEESQEEDLQSATWQEIVRNNIDVIEGVIVEITKPVENGDKQPDDLLQVANMICSMISFGVNSLSSELTHQDKFEQLGAYASGLVVVLWHLWNKSKKLWPPPKFRTPLKEFVETVRGIHELMEREFEEDLLEHLSVVSFHIRDLGKFNRYRRELGFMASFLESDPNNVNIGEVLLEVVNTRGQPQDSDTVLSDEAADSPTKKGKNKKTDTQENMAEGSRQREAETRKKKLSKQEMGSETTPTSQSSMFSSSKDIIISGSSYSISSGTIGNIYDSYIDDDRAEGSRHSEAGKSTVAKPTKEKTKPDQVIGDEGTESKTSGKNKAKSVNPPPIMPLDDDIPEIPPYPIKHSIVLHPFLEIFHSAYDHDHDTHDKVGDFGTIPPDLEAPPQPLLHAVDLFPIHDVHRSAIPECHPIPARHEVTLSSFTDVSRLIPDMDAGSQLTSIEDEGKGKESKAKDTTKGDFAAVSAEEHSAEDNTPAKKKRASRRLEEEGVAQSKVQETSKGPNKVTPPKSEDQVLESDGTGKGISPLYDDDDDDNAQAFQFDYRGRGIGYLRDKK